MSTSYSETMNALILQRRQEGASWFDIAKELGVTPDSVKWHWRNNLNPTPEPELPPGLPLRPVVISPAQPVQRRTEGESINFTSVHYSDVHFPFQSDAALKVLYEITEDLDPDLVVCHGDLLDCTSISRFEKDPAHRVTLQTEVEMAAEHLGKMSIAAPHARRVFIEGNHEDRVRRLIWEMCDDPRTAQLMRMPGVQQAMELPTLLGMPSSGWEYHTRRLVLHDRLILKHGNVVRKWSGMTAKAEWEKYGKGGMSGHTHRASAFIHRDWNGQHGWWELGCLCDLNPAYVEDPDWVNGFCVVTWSEDRSRYSVEQVLINGGQAFFRGRSYGRAD